MVEWLFDGNRLRSRALVQKNHGVWCQQSRARCPTYNRENEILRELSDHLETPLISTIPDVHSHFIYRFFQELRNLRLGRFTVESCYHCFSLILFNLFSFNYFTSFFIFFIHVQDFSMFVILSLNCLYLSSPSSFNFTMDEFIPWI